MNLTIQLLNVAEVRNEWVFKVHTFITWRSETQVAS
jgi:hypothetical protein